MSAGATRLARRWKDKVQSSKERDRVAQQQTELVEAERSRLRALASSLDLSEESTAAEQANVEAQKEEMKALIKKQEEQIRQQREVMQRMMEMMDQKRVAELESAVGPAASAVLPPSPKPTPAAIDTTKTGALAVPKPPTRAKSSTASRSPRRKKVTPRASSSSQPPSARQSSSDDPLSARRPTPSYAQPRRRFVSRDSLDSLSSAADEMEEEFQRARANRGSSSDTAGGAAQFEICENCEEHVAMVHCKDCEMKLCIKGCNQELHASHRSAYHERTELFKGALKLQAAHTRATDTGIKRFSSIRIQHGPLSRRASDKGPRLTRPTQPKPAKPVPHSKSMSFGKQTGKAANGFATPSDPKDLPSYMRPRPRSGTSSRPSTSGGLVRAPSTRKQLVLDRARKTASIVASVKKAVATNSTDDGKASQTATSSTSAGQPQMKAPKTLPAPRLARQASKKSTTSSTTPSYAAPRRTSTSTATPSFAAPRRSSTMAIRRRSSKNLKGHRVRKSQSMDAAFVADVNRGKVTKPKGGFLPSLENPQTAREKRLYYSRPWRNNSLLLKKGKKKSSKNLKGDSGDTPRASKRGSASLKRNTSLPAGGKQPSYMQPRRSSTLSSR